MAFDNSINIDTCHYCHKEFPKADMLGDPFGHLTCRDCIDFAMSLDTVLCGVCNKMVRFDKTVHQPFYEMRICNTCLMNS